MLNLPLEYLENFLLFDFKDHTKVKDLVEKINILGLESNLNKENNFIKFHIFSNRKDLLSWNQIIIEISKNLGINIKNKINHPKLEKSIKITISELNFSYENIHKLTSWLKSNDLLFKNIKDLTKIIVFILIETNLDIQINYKNTKKETISLSISALNFLNNIQETIRELNDTIDSENFISIDFINTIEDLTYYKNFLFYKLFVLKSEENIVDYLNVYNRKIQINHSLFNKKIGLDLNITSFKNLLNKTLFKWEENVNDTFTIFIPNNRKDLEIEEDVFEELLKLVDLKNYENNYNSLRNYEIILNKEYFDLETVFYDKISVIKKLLAIKGYIEIITLSLYSKEEQNKVNEILSIGENIELKTFTLINPKNSNHISYRNSLLSSHNQAIIANKKYNIPLLFFEISNIYHNNIRYKAIAISGINIYCDLHQNKKCNILKQIDNIINVLEISFNIDLKNILYFEEKNINNVYKNVIYLNKVKLGYAVIIEDMFFIEFYINIILKNIENYKRNISYKLKNGYSTQPICIKNISFWVSKEIFNSIDIDLFKNKIIELDKDKIQQIKIKDLYIQDTKISVNIELIFQDFFETLNKKTINELIDKISDHIKEEYYANIR